MAQDIGAGEDSIASPVGANLVFALHGYGKGDHKIRPYNGDMMQAHWAIYNGDMMQHIGRSQGSPLQWRYDAGAFGEPLLREKVTAYCHPHSHHSVLSSHNGTGNIDPAIVSKSIE